MDRFEDMRPGVEDADATGMVAGEELITQAETLLPTLPAPPEVPREQLHAALSPDHDAHAAIDGLHDELQQPQPNRAAIEAHVERLRGLPEVEATIANWWDSPAMQRFMWHVSQIGL
jgi:hypothetical protein